MERIQFIEPTLGTAAQLAANMRQEDVMEVWASDRFTPSAAVLYSWSKSDYISLAMVDNEPLAIFGLVKCNLLTGTGVVWLLGTSEISRYKRQFLSSSKAIVSEMLTICPRLCNKVHSRNHSSIMWLKWLGFILEDPIPHGPEGELFHPFYLERSQLCVHQ